MAAARPEFTVNSRRVPLLGLGFGIGEQMTLKTSRLMSFDKICTQKKIVLSDASFAVLVEIFCPFGSNLSPNPLHSSGNAQQSADTIGIPLARCAFFQQHHEPVVTGPWRRCFLEKHSKQRSTHHTDKYPHHRRRQGNSKIFQRLVSRCLPTLAEHQPSPVSPSSTMLRVTDAIHRSYKPRTYDIPVMIILTLSIGNTGDAFFL